MERKEAQFDLARWTATRMRTAELGHGIRSALADCAGETFSMQHFERGAVEQYHAKMHDLFDGSYQALNTPDDFWTQKLRGAFAALTSEAFAKEIKAILSFRMTGAFSDSPSRRSYRSGRFSSYAPWAAQLLPSMVRLYHCKESVTELIACDHDNIFGFDWLLGYRLQQGDASVKAAIREALLGDNQTVTLSRTILQAVIISGDEELLSLLLGMLKTAGLQEGLRQAILESADRGSLEVFTRIFGVCLKENLFRFSSAKRALDVWAGLGYDDGREKLTKKLSAIAYACLTDENARQGSQQSADNLEAYLALWALGCRSFEQMLQAVRALLDDKNPNRRALGWYLLAQSSAGMHGIPGAEQTALAVQYASEPDVHPLAWLVQNLNYSRTILRYYQQRDQKPAPIPNPELPQKKAERQEMFDALTALAKRIGAKKTIVDGNPFPFIRVELERWRVMLTAMSLAAVDMDPAMVEALTQMTDLMDPDLRQSFTRTFLDAKSNAQHRALVVSMLRDRSDSVRRSAAATLAECRLDAENIEAMTQQLTSKSGETRREIVSLLQAQPFEMTVSLPSTLLSSKNEQQVQAGLELLQLQQAKHPEQVQRCRPALEALRERKLLKQTEILLDQLLPDEAPVEEYTAENGWGLFDPAKVEAGTKPVKPGILNRMLARGGSVAAAARAMIPSWKEFDSVMRAMDDVFTRHADFSYETSQLYGEKTTVLLGDVTGEWMPLLSLERPWETSREQWLEHLPFCDEFDAALDAFRKVPAKLAGLLMAVLDDNHGVIETWHTALDKSALLPGHTAKARRQYPRAGLMIDILRHLIPAHFDGAAYFSVLKLFYKAAVEIMGQESLTREGRVSTPFHSSCNSFYRNYYLDINHPIMVILRREIGKAELSDESFAEWFSLEHPIEHNTSTLARFGLQTQDYLRAESLGLIGRDTLYAFLTEPQRGLPEKIGFLTDPNPSVAALRAKYPEAESISRTLVSRLVEIETRRGELPTPLSEHCNAIMRLYGSEHFASLLAALGKDNFHRGYEYSRSTEKKAVLSRMLRRCYPGAEDTPETLKAALAASGASEKRLAEAAMYAPQWARLIEQVIGWPGLHCAVWFFHAHVNEQFSAEKETEAALYSPIAPQQFNDGALDRDWFLQAYNTLGEKRFQTLYKAAKYITNGSNAHRRSQLYADAALGRFEEEALRREILEKRNQDRLRCYPLLPMDADDTAEALKRYEFLQQFLKESRQFGAQRRESERKAVSAALDNLAATLGLSDRMRLIWRMEGEKLRQNLPLLEPQTLGEFQVRIAIDDGGTARVAVEKGGKALKTMPKAIAKDPVILELKTTVKELREQKRRARESLERAMTDCASFTAPEVRGLLQNPVLAPMVSRLLWIGDGVIGMAALRADQLCLETLTGAVPAPDALRLAHPHDLKEAGVWSDWMHRLYAKTCVQPFKQVFREYYPLTEEERRERTISRRYAGNQIQARRAVGMLRGRGWTVDYELGLQKVFYREDLVVHIFALADWFSPSDIEAPTIETVQFTRRHGFEPVALEDVPPVLFSEVMRDIDLVVSAAHAGGVDPEASHSTVELRAALAQELLIMLGVPNVTWSERHARIEGSLATYSVHLGSGVVHAQGVGAIAILPVHSQARGRIFLPFADEDPKTAEVLSKILLLAEDQKIKDPEILRQITGR